MTPEQYDARIEDLLNRTRKRASEISALALQCTGRMAALHGMQVLKTGQAYVPEELKVGAEEILELHRAMLAPVDEGGDG